MNYNLNIGKLIKELVPAFLRSPRQLDWLTALISPLETLSQSFSSFRSTTNDALIWNGQTISLENAISQKLGPGVTIKNTGKAERPFYIYGAGNGRNQQVAMTGDPRNPSVYETGEFDLNTVDFEVELPSGSAINRYQLETLINQYKLYSKRFKIVEK